MNQKNSHKYHQCFYYCNGVSAFDKLIFLAWQFRNMKAKLGRKIMKMFV